MTTDPNTFLADMPARLTEAELARHWRVSSRTLQRWRETGSGPGWFKLNGRILYASSEVVQFEEAHRFPGDAP